MINRLGRSFLRYPDNSQGVTLVEALLAIGLISIVALSSVTFYSEMAKVSHRSREACRIYNLSFLGRLRTYGTIASIANFTPEPFVRSVNPSAPPFTSPPEVPGAYRWPNVPILSTGSEPTLNSYLLIDGYMNILQSLYNAHPGICTTFTKIGSTNTTGLNSLMIPYPEDLKDPTTDSGMKIRIIPFNIDTGAHLNCSTAAPPLKVAPRGTYLNPTAGGSPFQGTDYGGTRKLSIPSDVRLNVGFAVQVQTQFENDQGGADVCFTEGRYQYDIDSQAPPEPKVLDITLATSPSVCSAHSVNDYTLNVGYDSSVIGSRLEPGTVLICQDLSVIPTVAQAIIPQVTGYATQAAFQCYTGNNASAPAPPGPQVGSNYPANGYYPVAGYTGFNYTGLGSVVPPRWVPCDQLTLCGVAPMSGGVTNTSSSGSPTRLSYQIRYRNLPSDCRVIVKVAGIDTAANSSPELPSPSLADFSSNNPVFSTWDVPRPKCQSFCSTGPWPSGYFTCGSC